MAVNANFSDMFRWLDSFGFTQAILPFFIIFALLFVILQQLNIFKEKKDNKDVPNRKINAILSAAISLLVVIPHVTGSYPAGTDPIEIFSKILPGGIVILIAVLLVLIMMGLVGANQFAGNTKAMSWVAAIALIALALIVLNSLSDINLPSWLYWLNDSSVITIVVALIVLALVIMYITKDPDAPEGEGIKGWFKT